MKLGIDVSSYQGKIDWTKVAEAGVQFAILKVIRKDLTPDTRFEENWQNAAKAGVPVVGVYNYSYANTVEKAIGDATRVLKILGSRKVKVYLDVEADCLKGLGTTLVDIINAYASVIKSSGLEFGVYTGRSFYDAYIKQYADKLDYPFWIARYPSSESTPFGTQPDETKRPILLHQTDGWQFSQTGAVPGINGAVDLDILYTVEESSKEDETTGTDVTMSAAEVALEYALHIAADDTYGYDQTKRWGPNYDCSALVIESYEKAGVPVKAAGATYTGNMYKAFLACGFIDVTKDINLATGEGLEPGDVCLKPNSHVVMFVMKNRIVHASINEKGTTTGGKSGDQTGKEICSRTYYNKPWKYVLRYVGDQPRKNIKELAKEVIDGKWGNGTDRKKRITGAGYDYEAVRQEVNRILKAAKNEPTIVRVHTVKKGDTLSKLAKKYDTTIYNIVVNNKAKYPKITASYIVAGWKLMV